MRFLLAFDRYPPFDPAAGAALIGIPPTWVTSWIFTAPKNSTP